MQANKQIIFLHMPKCAGQSIRTPLESAYGKHITKDYKDSYFKIPMEKRFSIIKKELEASSRIHAKEGMIYGHFFPIKYMNQDTITNNIERRFITFLRDPLERLASHYCYWKSLKNSDHYLWLKMMKRDWSFEQFALSNEMKNFYSQHLFQFPINKFDFLGIHENIEEDWKKLCEYLEIRYEKLPHKKNSGSKIFLSRIPTETKEKIRAFHAEDYFIYDFALEKTKN